IVGGCGFRWHTPCPARGRWPSGTIVLVERGEGRRNMHTPISKTWLALALSAGACAAGDSVPTGERGDGSYRYVLGYDEVTGKSIYGGGHLVVELSDPRGKAEAIDDPNRANRLHPDLAGDAYGVFDPALTGGETDWDVFASNWWPSRRTAPPGAGSPARRRTTTT